MKFNIGEFFGSLVMHFSKLPTAQKIAIPFLLVSSMGIIIFVSNWASKPEYATLFSDLAETDAAAVVEYLKDNKIGFVLADNGSTVKVTPADSVHQVRLELAAGGMPRNGRVGLELFNESSLGLTGFAEKINFVRGLQGELERTIGSIEAVKAVRVHITNPDRSVFITRDVLPTASVLLRVRPGAELTKLQIKGITNLVANSVERLTPENVTVLDSSGQLLNETHSEEELQGADVTKLDYQRRFEATLSERIEKMLSKIMGPGSAVARVSAEFDFSRREREEESFDPAGQVARSERSVQEAAGLGGEGGIPGVISNLTTEPPVLNAPNGGDSGNNSRRESVTNYEVSRAVSRTVSAAGKLQRISVAVLVDGKHVTVGEPAEDGAVQKEYQALPAEMVAKIENLVKQAVGFDADRGDTVTVENIQFFEPDPAIAKEMDTAEGEAFTTSLISMAVPAVLGLMFLLLVVRPLIKGVMAPARAETDLRNLLPRGVDELSGRISSERSNIGGGGGGGAAGGAVNVEELEELLAENSRMVKSNPQQAALLIQSWLNEGS